MYFLKVAVGLVERTDEQCGSLDELLVLFLLLAESEVAADVKAFIIRKDYPANCEEFIDYLFQEFRALASHNNFRL